MTVSVRDENLQNFDTEIFDLIEKEKERQKNGIELIASENFVSRAVLEALGSALTNKYSEGQVGQRYYGGNDVIDKIEKLCKDRLLKVFELDGDEWGVNVQPYSGSPANLAAYTAVLKPHDRLMGLDLPSGGHLTHGYYTAKKKISATSVFFESFPYRVKEETGLIDFQGLEEQAMIFRPKLIIAGASAYPRVIDFKKFREICDKVGALLLVDMAHISGLVATGLHPSPFPFADIVTTTSHKTLRGPRSGVIFYKFKNAHFDDMKERIDMAVFPALQGGPHNHQIAALAVQLKEVETDSFKRYSQNVVENCQTLAHALMGLGHKLTTGGTDNHLLVWDLGPHDLTGNKMEKVCDFVGITLNRNTVPGDKSALNPSGVRIGTPAMTTRGVQKEGWVFIAELLDEICQEAKEIQANFGRKISEFEKGIAENEKLKEIKKIVRDFSSNLFMPGK